MVDRSLHDDGNLLNLEPINPRELDSPFNTASSLFSSDLSSSLVSSLIMIFSSVDIWFVVCCFIDSVAAVVDWLEV